MLRDNLSLWQVTSLGEALTYTAHGIYPEVFVGSLDRNVADRLEAGDTSARDVRISAENIRHIEDGHPDITIRLLAALLPDILNDGHVILMNKSPNKAFISYQHPDGQRRFGAWIKRTRDGKLYCTTVYRIRRRNTRSLLKRGITIRNHKPNRRPSRERLFMSR